MGRILSNKKFEIDEITYSTASVTKITYTDYEGESQYIMIDSTDLEELAKLLKDE